jgi:arginine decarboxylase
VPPRARPRSRETPLLDAYLSALRREGFSFTVPGHKGLVGSLDERLALAVSGDLPLYGGVDTVKLYGGYRAEAERLAAKRYEADWCRFSTGGSTHANQTLCLALGQPGDEVIVNRSLHRSLLLGLVLAGLTPRWLPTGVDWASGMPIGTSVEDLEEALSLCPGAKAVFLTEPGYLGTLSDLPRLAAAAHDAGVPVFVDQAWGAHFGYHPELPAHALASGADAMVTSIHKLLPGHSQASLLCARFDRIDPGRLERAFEATHTTSPAGSILASIDGALALMEELGAELLSGVLDLVRSARRSLSEALPGLSLPDASTFARLGADRFDDTRLVVRLSPLGADGVEVERAMLADGLSLELADRDTLLPVVTVADGEQSVGALVQSLVHGVEATGRGAPRPLAPAMSWRVDPVTIMSPAAAFFARHERIPADEAVGRVAAELVAPYPPGIPVLAPGELVTVELVTELRAVAAEGTRIAYAADPSLETLEVVV